MHKNRMLKLADRLEKLKPEKFSMDAYIRNQECGTSCCVAGHTLLMAGWKCVAGPIAAFISRTGVLLSILDVGERAQKYLGLTDKQADKLFYTGYSRTNKDAAQIVRNMVKNGK